MQNNPESVLDQWLSALNQGSVEQLLGLYDENAILLPTFSDTVFCGTNHIIEYFNKLAGYQNLSVRLYDDTLKVQNLSDTASVLSGIYFWQFEVDGEAKSFEARFTYAVDTSSSRPILNHHSSQLPKSP